MSVKSNFFIFSNAASPCWISNLFLREVHKIHPIWLWLYLFFLVVLSVFALHILHLCCLMYIHLRLLHVLGWLTLCHHVMFFLIPGIFCALKPILYANKAIPVSFSLMFVCYIFFHLFYFQPIYTITETKSTVFTSIFALSMSFLSLWCSRNPSFIIFSLFR